MVEGLLGFVSDFIIGLMARYFVVRFGFVQSQLVDLIIEVELMVRYFVVIYFSYFDWLRFISVHSFLLLKINL